MDRLILLITVLLVSITVACQPSLDAIYTSPTAATFLPVTVLPSPTGTLLPPTEQIPVTPCSPFIRHPLEMLPDLLSLGFTMPGRGRDNGHPGADFAHWSLGEETSVYGDPLQAILPGKVASVIADRFPYGNMLLYEVSFSTLPSALVEGMKIPEDRSLYVLYAHLQSPVTLAIGDPVTCGVEIARVGNSGDSVTAHLHLETQLGPPGMTFPKMAYYSADATPEELASYEAWHKKGIFQPLDPMLVFKLLAPEPNP